MFELIIFEVCNRCQSLLGTYLMSILKENEFMYNQYDNTIEIKLKYQGLKINQGTMIAYEPMWIGMKFNDCV